MMNNAYRHRQVSMENPSLPETPPTLLSCCYGGPHAFVENLIFFRYHPAGDCGLPEVPEAVL